MAISSKRIRILTLIVCFGVVSLIFLTIRLKDTKEPWRAGHRGLKSLGVPASEIIPNFYTKLLRAVNLTSKDNRTKGKDILSPEEISPDGLSKIVQGQLSILQNPKNCSVPTLLCGHQDACGLGCQIHHRIVCLMISFATGMPLIHDVTTYWPYTKLWGQTFYPLGSSCTPGPNTRKLDSGKSEKLNVAMNSTGPDFPFPLDGGIVVPKILADKVELIHSDPFFWWVGQFMKYGLRLLPEERKMVQDAQVSINFSRPIVGIHIRRTDKLNEYKNANHSIEKYISVAEDYYLNLTEQGIPFNVKRVFLASDDQSVLSEAQRIFKMPEWEIIGFNYNETFKTQDERKGALDQMVTDLFTLIDCDYVVCTYSSNVCRAIAGMLHMNHLDGLKRIKSIDNEYTYLLFGHGIPLKIIKI